MTLPEQYARDRKRLVGFARRLLLAWHVSDADQLAEDVVQNAVIYGHERFGDADMHAGWLVRCVRWTAHKMAATDTNHVVVRNTAGEGRRHGDEAAEDKRRARTTSFFPNQIFGCRLADASGPFTQSETQDQEDA